MNNNELLAQLQKEAKTNPIANAVFHMWALRKRARQVVTIEALSQRMKSEGFTYPDAQYRAFLKQLAALGLGTLESDSKGRPRALKGISMTLQSIGKAACGGSTKLQGNRPRNKFNDIEVKVSNGNFPAIKEDKPLITLGFMVNGKPIKFEMPKDLTPDEIAALVVKLTNDKAA